MQDPRKVQVAVPAYTGDAAAETMNSLLQARQYYEGVNWLIGCCHIGLARNELCRAFLDNGWAEKLVFVDTDIVFTGEHFRRLTNYDEPIVAGIYTLRSPEGKAAFSPDLRYPPPTEHGLWRVRRAATGFMCISKEALLTIREKGGDRWYDQNGVPVYDFFPSGLTMYNGKRQFITDDYGFCDLATISGLPVYVDTAVVVGHKGTITFEATIELPKLQEEARMMARAKVAAEAEAARPVVEAAPVDVVANK